MEKIPKKVWIPIVLLICMSAYHSIFDIDSWRYKMTVEVDTPEGVKSGYAVRGVTREKGNHLFTDMGSVITVVGEAVVVDLGKRGVLFAVTRSKRSDDYGVNILFDTFPGDKKSGKVVLAPAQYPMFIWFKDISDPTTAHAVVLCDGASQHVAEHSSEYCFSQAFGKGVKVKDVQIEIVQESVTSGIQKWLPWLPRYDGIIGETDKLGHLSEHHNPGAKKEHFSNVWNW